MNWDKEIGLDDVWNWIKEKLHIIGLGHEGGFTPRREVSRISPVRFDDILSPNRLSRKDQWAMEAYDLAERTGLWDSNMADGPVIDGRPNKKLEK